MRHDDLDYKKQQSNCQDMKWKERRWKDQKREEMEKSVFLETLRTLPGKSARILIFLTLIIVQKVFLVFDSSTAYNTIMFLFFSKI